MKWTNTPEKHGWVGENGFEIILVDFHAGRAFWEVYQNDQKIKGGEFDADDLDKAKSFCEQKMRTAC